MEPGWSVRVSKVQQEWICVVTADDGRRAWRDLDSNQTLEELQGAVRSLVDDLKRPQGTPYFKQY